MSPPSRRARVEPLPRKPRSAKAATLLTSKVILLPSMASRAIFEALTARDRPYKRAKTLSESMAIMARMTRDGHLDPDLFDVFVLEKVYLDYARRFLETAQIDAIDEAILSSGAARERPAMS